MFTSLVSRFVQCVHTRKLARRNQQKTLTGSTIESFESREMLSAVQMSYEHPGANPVQPGQENVWMGTIHIISDTDDVIISDGSLVMTENSDLLAGDIFTDVHLRNSRTGRHVYAYQGTGTGTASRERFFGAPLEAGLNSFEIYADLSPDLHDGDRVRASLAMEDFTFAGRDIGIEVETIDGDAVEVLPDRPMLIGAWLSIEAPMLHTTVISNGSSDTAVVNQKDVGFIQFESMAEGEDILLTDLTAQALEGSAFNAWQYTLWVDTDGDLSLDTVLQDGVAADSFGYIRFQNITGGGYIIPNGDTVRFGIHADIASSPASNTLRLGLVGMTTERLADGSNVDWTINNTQQATLVHIVDHGSLYVTLDSASVRSRDMLGGALSESILRLNLRAEDENTELTYIGFTAGPGYQSLDRLELFWEGETSPFGIATIGSAKNGDELGYSGFDQIVESQAEDRDLIVRARVKSDSNGSVSGDNIQLEVTTVEARGITSAEDLILSDGVYFGHTQTSQQQLIGKENRIVHSRINSIVNANPASGLVPSGISTIGAFRFAAATNHNFRNGTNKVRLGELSLFIQTDNVELDINSFQLYNLADSSSLAGLGTYRTVVDTNGIHIVFYDLSGIDTVIASGDHITLGIRADVLNSQVQPGSSLLQVSMRPDSIVWFDEDAGTSTRFAGIEYPDEIIRSTQFSS